MFQILIVITGLALAGCSVIEARLDYADFKPEMPISIGAPGDREVGTIEGSAGGFVWSSCDAQTRMAIHHLIARARGMGANAIGNVRWRADGSAVPSCKRNWGLVFVPVFLLTPLFASAHVDGIGYRVSRARLGLWLLPAPGGEAAFIDRVLAWR